MKLIPLRKKNAALPAPVERTAEIRTLKERYENITRIADVADRLLTLEAFKEEVKAMQMAEWEYMNSLYTTPQMLTTLLLPAVLGASVLVAGLGPWCIPVAALGLGGGMMLMDATQRMIVRNYHKTYSDHADAGKMIEGIDAAKAEILKTADVKAVARSPRAVEVFEAYPKLKERFMLVAAVDKVREEDLLLTAGALGKAPPAGAKIDI